MAIGTYQRQIIQLRDLPVAQSVDRLRMMSLDEASPAFSIPGLKVETARLAPQSPVCCKSLRLLRLDQLSASLPDAMQPGQDAAFKGLLDSFIVEGKPD